MTALTAFDFEDTPVRAFEREDGTIWFIAADICAALCIKNTSQAVAALDPDERSMFNIGRQGETNVISEGGLYTLVLRSRQATKPGTRPHRFRKWVTGEVLPAIRRTGRYAAPAPAEGEPFDAWPVHELRAKIQLVEMYRRNHGLKAARWMSREVGFPEPPAATKELVSRHAAEAYRAQWGGDLPSHWVVDGEEDGL